MTEIQQLAGEKIRENRAAIRRYTRAKWVVHCPFHFIGKDFLGGKMTFWRACKVLLHRRALAEQLGKDIERATFREQYWQQYFDVRKTKTQC